MANMASSMSGMATPSTMIPARAIIRPPAPTIMITISQVFTIRMIFALSIESASWPERAESTKKGRVKRQVVSAENQFSACSL